MPSARAPRTHCHGSGDPLEETVARYVIAVGTARAETLSQWVGLRGVRSDGIVVALPKFPVHIGASFGACPNKLALLRNVHETQRDHAKIILGHCSKR